MIKLQQCQVLTSHFESFWSIVKLNHGVNKIDKCAIFRLHGKMTKLPISCYITYLDHRNCIDGEI